MFYRERFPVIIRKSILFVFVVVTAMLQNTNGLFPTVYGVHFCLMLPLIVCIGAFERELSGLLYGALGGCLIDTVSSGPDGVNALAFALIGCISGLIMHYKFRNSLFAAFLINIFFCALYFGGSWFINVFIPVGDMQFRVLTGRYLPSAAASSLIIPLSYYPVRFCRKYLKETDMIFKR